MDKPILPASTLILVRDQPRFETLLVTRHHQVDFASNASVFPGGKIDPQDLDQRWADHADGWEATPAHERSLRIAAAREAFEESAIMLARANRAMRAEDWGAIAAARDDVAKKRATFLDIVAKNELRVDLEALVPFARWITPGFMPKRFDAMFYIAIAPADQVAVSDGWETVDAEWLAPEDALRLGAAGERTVLFPTRLNLQRLNESANARQALDMARGRPLIAVEPRRERRDDGDYLLLDADAGYGDAFERIIRPAR